jgi:hypothetical protein
LNCIGEIKRPAPKIGPQFAWTWATPTSNPKMGSRRCDLRELTIYRECVQHRARDSPLDWELRHIWLRKLTT